jgi:hypothetical protein
MGKVKRVVTPFGWFQRTQRVGASFRLDPENQGFVASF